MKLEYKNDFHSIKQFTSTELPDFSILTGVNGSGKTHLLKAIQNGDVVIDSIEDVNDIIYFDYMEFRVSNEPEQNSFQLRQEQKATWDLLDSQNIPRFGTLKNNLLSIKSSIFPMTADSEKISEIAKTKNKPLLSLTKKDLDDVTYEKISNYKKRLKQIFSHPELLKHGGTLPTIVFVSKKFNSFLDEITYVEFTKLFEPIHLKENLLPIEIGKIFLKYRMSEFQECSANLQKINGNTTEIKKRAEEKCMERYNGQKPWEVVNSFLSTFSNFDYKLSFPEELDLSTYSNQDGPLFTPMLLDKKRDLAIPYNQLSSGEQILFSLALCLFKSKSDNMFPKLLLLDEIDATLHPSMIENLFNVINEVFLKNGTKVILSTHSPTTIALSDENSVFVVNKDGENKIEKSTKKNALHILTEGFATLEEGLHLADQLSNKELVIITEGKNVQYIKKTMEFFANDLIDNVDVLEGIEDITGKGQLKLFWDLFSSIPHTNKLLFVWDPDVENYRNLETKNKTYAYTFLKNISNNLCDKGIENLFSIEMFDGFTKTITDDATQETIIEFNAKKYKNDFLDRMMLKGEIEFQNFKPLFDHVRTILNT
ncbi:AAA family ATPase [Nitrosopumilus oxyclinae]|nr:ATP-binding protein [Nitrosopumilus oxyclinae]